MFLLFSQLPDLIETLDPQPLEELLPGEERAHLDPIGIRDGFSFLNSWSGGHLSAVFEDICVGHDVLGTREPSCADGTGEPRICGWFYIRGAEGSTRTSLPLTKEHTGALVEYSFTWRCSCSWALGADRDTVMTHMQHPNVVTADTRIFWGMNFPHQQTPLKTLGEPSPGPSFEHLKTERSV